MKYIDAEELKKKVSNLGHHHIYCRGDFHDGVLFTIEEVQSIIDSLMQEEPEVDLDEEIYFWIKGGGLIYPMSNKEKINIENTADTFYKLGLKARKKKNNMTKEERIIATAFTGIMFIDGPEMELLYEYMEKKIGHGVFDLMLTSKKFWEELHKACEQDFINMVSKEPPEVDLNEEITAYIESHFHIRYDETLEVGNDPLTTADFEAIARHFFELGLNAKEK